MSTRTKTITILILSIVIIALITGGTLAEDGTGHFIDSGQSLGNTASDDVALGDLDGDGDLDAFVIKGKSGGAPNEVWLNDGSGFFFDSGQQLGNDNSNGVALADLDGDGDLDAFVSNGPAGVSGGVWFNNGSGVFTTSNQSLGTGNSVGIALGDLDGDGDIDAWVGNAGQVGTAGEPDEVWLNDGTGAFLLGQSVGSTQSRLLDLGDIDGDGDLDALVANYQEPGVVWLNDGTGNFTDSGQQLTSVEGVSFVLGDLDGDGDLDAFATNGIVNSEPDTVWINDGAGNFTDSGQSLGDSKSRAAALGDIDEDGDLDAFVTTKNEANVVWLNDGSALFIDSGQQLGDADSSSVALADLDGDSDLDAFVTNINQPDKVWLNGSAQVNSSILFFDDFSGDLSLWDIYNGTWSIQDGELSGQGWGGYVDGWIYAGNQTWSDYSVEAKVIFVDENAEVLVRSTEHRQNEYRIEIWEDRPGVQYENRYSITKFQNGEKIVFTAAYPGSLHGNAQSPVPITNPSYVKVSVEGDIISLHINGQHVDSIQDPDPLPAGRFGLGVIWSYRNRFDDVRVESLMEPFTDLSLSVADISFVPPDPDPGEQVTISAQVHNPGWTELSNIAVEFYDFDTPIGQTTIGTLAPGTAETVSLQTTFADSGFRLTTVKVDPADLIAELNEYNNEAGKVLPVGSPNFSEATMVIQASASSTCQGAAVSISGQADYDFTQIPGTEDYPVQGGSVTVSILDSATNEVISVYTGSHTNVSGAYSQGVVAPEEDGIYPIVVSVTDRTITAETQTTLTVSGPCQDPGTNPGTGGGDPSNGDPGSEPGVTADLYVYSEDIRFSDSNPDPDETMNLFAFINYRGDDPVIDVPVMLNDIYPVGGVLRTFQIGDTLVDFPNGQESSPVAVTTPWTNTAEGAHIIQAVIDPPFSQFTGNDKATRLIIVGDPSLLYITKSVTLLLDADVDGNISPGDTLVYTLSYENQGSSDVTGGFITDDYDETLLEMPAQISNGGAAAGGVITWDLGTLAPGTSTSVTYEVNIKPDTEFPSGKSIITNYALLSGDGVPTAGASSEVEVVVNVAPEVVAGDNMTVNEGDEVTLTATGSDYEGYALTYAWDLDGDGTYETPGQTVSWTAVDGPGDYILSVQVTDTGGLTATDHLTITVLNVAPDVGPITATLEPVPVATEISASADFTDPGVLDTHTAVWEWGDETPSSAGLVDETNGSGTVTGKHTYGTPGVYAVKVTVTDKDGYSDYSIYQFIVVYDPEGGFVTGGGWINSPEGAYTPDPSLTGKANFGFVSKYKKGANTPTGNTEFQFKAGDLNFHSSDYDWLVVAGPQAKFKGTGTINGDGEYGFMISAVDGQVNGGGGIDKFRIKIWDKATDEVIYDNQLGAEKDAAPTTELGGGSIVIHKAK